MMKKLKVILKIAIPLALGILIFWWVYRKMDFEQIIEIMQQGVRYPWLVLSCLIGLLSHLLRAIRWRMLIRLLGINPQTSTMLNSVFINYGANLILPRLGEFSRCVFISQKEKFSFSKIFGTLLSERLIDSILVLLLIFGGFFTMNDIYLDFLENHVHIHIPFHKWLTSPEFYLLIAFLSTTGYIVFKRTHHPRMAIKIRVILRELWIGVKTLVILPHKTEFFLLTIALWLCYLLQIYVCFFAFDFTKHLGLNICLAIFIMGNIAFALPVQGGIGPWHMMVISTLMFYGLEEMHAAAFALVAHSLITIVNALAGIYAVAFSGTGHLKNKEIE